MSTLQTFVLEYLQDVGGLVEAVAHGVHEVVLPDEVAQQWHVPTYQQIAFDDVSDAPVTRLAYNHPLVEELIAAARTRAASACVYINDLRLDKSGLADLARSTWILPNSRVTELREGTIARVRSTCVLFNFKAALVSDEKREQLVSIVMDANAGHAVAPQYITQAVNGYAPDATLKTLPHAPMRWGASEGTPPTQPLALATLQALLQRAQVAVRRELAEPLQSLQQRSRRFRELDEARLQEYYDDMARDLQQRLSTAQPERRASLEDKLTAVASERAAKLADVAERYQVRLDLTLLNLLVVVQPKLVLPVSVETRTTKVQTHAIWDPLRHCLEPLVCTVCGEPSERTLLCHHGHFAHQACLAPSCVDCKRAFCLQCGDAVGSCAVCAQPLCRYSRLACRHCGRGTCQAHAGLCHANAGQPAAVNVPQLVPDVPAPAPAPPPVTPQPVAKSAPKKSPHPAPRRKPVPPRVSARLPVGVPKPQRLEVVIEHDLAVVSAYVLATRERQVAVRAWELSPEGIAVFCRCEKGRACRKNHLVLRPANATGIDKQLLMAIDELCQEYGVPSKKVSFNQRVAGRMVPQRRFTLPDKWKDDTVLEQAREGFQRLF